MAMTPLKPIGFNSPPAEAIPVPSDKLASVLGDRVAKELDNSIPFEFEVRTKGLSQEEQDFYGAVHGSQIADIDANALKSVSTNSAAVVALVDDETYADLRKQK